MDIEKLEAESELLNEFTSKIEIDEETGCWNWKGSLMKTGYGLIQPKRRYKELFGIKLIQAHRLSYLQYKGPLTKGLCLDHLCRNPSCVNPDHLEEVSYRENTLRGLSPAANRRLWDSMDKQQRSKFMRAARNGALKKRAAATTCKRGHPWDEKNSYVDQKGHRFCRACHAMRQRRYNKQSSINTGGYGAI